MRSLRKAEKSHKRRWLLKKGCNNSKCNPYKAGKSLLDSKCFVSLKIDQHKASCVKDKSYDVPLDELEALHHNLKSLKCLKKVASLMMIS